MADFKAEEIVQAQEAATFTIYTIPRYSRWTCYLFGNQPNGSGLCWTPYLGQEPNWFWRWMQFLVFGNRWVKKEDK